MCEWLEVHRKALFAGATVIVVVVAVCLHHHAPHLLQAQWTTSLVGFRPAEIRRGLHLDGVFIAAYLAWFVAAFWLIRDPNADGRFHPAAMAGALLAAGAALADVFEDIFLSRALGQAAYADELTLMRAAGLVKWTLLVAAILTLLTLLFRRVWRPAEKPQLPTARPAEPHCAAHGAWDPPAPGTKPKVGVCLSGGGIRSAAFCLGGLQAMRDQGKLGEARYLAAASGGGYLAAGWALSDAGPPGDADPDPMSAARWSRNSPEERWFRDHASYLIPDLKGGIAGLSRLLGGLLVNLLLIGLVLFAASRPVGWVMYAFHKSLRAELPAFLVRDAEADMDVGSITFDRLVDNGAGPPAQRYRVMLVPSEKPAACFDGQPYRSRASDFCVYGAQDDAHPGIVDVKGGRAEIVGQPAVKAVDPLAKAWTRPKKLSVEQPKLGLKDDVVRGPLPVAAQFEVERQPRVNVKTGLFAVTYPTYEWWMWEVVGGLLAASLFAGLVVMAARLRGRPGAVGRSLARSLAAMAMLAFLVVIALPWLVVWLPRTLTSLTHPTTKSSSGSGLQDYLLPGGGMLALIVTAAGKYLGGGALSPGKAWGALRKQSTKLKWYALSPLKVVTAVLASVGLVTAFVNLLQFASANGPDGQLMGFAFVRDYLPGWLFLPEWAKFGLAVGALVVFAFVADAQSWSLYPFYKARLSSAFLLRRTDPDHAVPVCYDSLLPFTTMSLPGGNGPQYIACCSVNLSEYGVVPPGRRAASFTFSSTEIGGPLVGYATPAEYEAGLPLNRRRDVTVASAMAISGAAFSPAMGKFNLGPVGALLALANLRLGVWIPHPKWVVAGSWWRWILVCRPNWLWFVRELRNKYRLDRRYLYVSDGGHWDNLGLVELLRRGCNEIYCISGAGDGALSFGTIAEAIALAREELGVQIELDPSPLRGAIGDPPAASPGSPSAWARLRRWIFGSDPAPAAAATRELRREGAKETAAAFAAASFVTGTITFPGSEAAPGTIYYVEADLTEDMPFDVHGFAESETVFPDDSTGDQVFDHRQFESYRALGYHQTKAVF